MFLFPIAGVFFWGSLSLLLCLPFWPLAPLPKMCLNLSCMPPPTQVYVGFGSIKGDTVFLTIRYASCFYSFLFPFLSFFLSMAFFVGGLVFTFFHRVLSRFYLVKNNYSDLCHIVPTFLPTPPS